MGVSRFFCVNVRCKFASIVVLFSLKVLEAVWDLDIYTMKLSRRNHGLLALCELNLPKTGALICSVCLFSFSYVSFYWATKKAIKAEPQKIKPFCGKP